MTTTIEAPIEAGPEKIVMDHYNSGQHIIARRFDAIVQSKIGGQFETVSHARRAPIDRGDVVDILEDAMVFGHGTDADPKTIKLLTRRYVDGFQAFGIEPLVGKEAPCSSENLNTLALMALLDTDPNTDRADSVREVLFGLHFDDEAEGQASLKFAKTDGTLERLGPDIYQMYLELYSLGNASHQALCEVTASALSQGLFREELREIRARAKRTAIEQRVAKGLSAATEASAEEA